MKGIKKRWGLVFATLYCWVAMAAPAIAGVVDKTADDVANTLSEAVKGILYPLGGLIVFIAAVIVSFKLITTAGKPQERAAAMESIPYILGGAILLGGSMLIAGLALNLMKTVGG